MSLSKIPFVHLQWGSVVNSVGFYALCICCCCYWVSKLCLTLGNPIEYSMPGSPVLHHLPEFSQTHVHWIGDLSNHFILKWPFSSCPQTFPALGSFPTSQLFPSGGQRIAASESVFPMSIQSWLVWLVWSFCQRDSRVFSISVIWKHQFFSAQSSLWSNSRTCTWLLEKPQFWLYRSLSAKWCLYLLIHCLGLS